MSPQQPEMFYDITNPGMDIRHGDVLVSRCTMNSMSRKQSTAIGWVVVYTSALWKLQSKYLELYSHEWCE